MNSSAKQSVSTVTAVKGHLVTKSSPLAIGNCKLEAQYLTAQNMASHYKRVINAKPTIDISPPKSMIQSQKARDRAKREIMRYSVANKSVDRARSAEVINDSISEEQTESKSSRAKTASYRPTESGKTLRIDEMKPRALPNQTKLNKSMSNLMFNFTKHSNNRVMVYKPPNNNQQAPAPNKSQVFSPFATKTIADNRNKDTSMLSFNAKNTSSNSISHPALKAMSHLANKQNYDVLDIHSDRFKQPSKEFEPRIKNNDKSVSSLTKSTCYQPPRRRKKNDGNSTAQSTARESFSDEEKNANEDIKNYSMTQNTTRNSGLNDSNILNTSASTGLKRTAQKEEEIKYLVFIKEVTDDIIARGITSNRVINNCFDFHVKKNLNTLDERKMRELLNTLREDIGMPENREDGLEIDTKYHHSLNKAIILDKQRNKENEGIDPNDSSYLILKKFGWSGSDSKNNESLNKSSSSLGKHGLGENLEGRSSTKKSSKKDEYENQIKKNIQSIRRNSKSSQGSSNDSNADLASDNNENEVINNIFSKRRSSSNSLNKTNISDKLKVTSPILKHKHESASNSHNNSQTNAKKLDDSDDDDHIIASKPKLNEDNISLNKDSRSSSQSSPTKQNDNLGKASRSSSSPSPTKFHETNNPADKASRSNSSSSPSDKHQANLNASKLSQQSGKRSERIKSDYSDDALFNNDYGEPDGSENNESHHNLNQKNVDTKKTNDEEEEEHDEDGFNNSLLTKTFKRNDFPKMNSETKSKDEMDGNIKPKPSPRKFQPARKNRFDFDSDGDDDEF